jgi:hypothetical protein
MAVCRARSSPRCRPGEKQTDWLGNGMTVNDLLELSENVRKQMRIKRGGPLVAESCPITPIR